MNIVETRWHAQEGSQAGVWHVAASNDLETRDVVGFLTQEVAEHVARVHNESLDAHRAPGTSGASWNGALDAAAAKLRSAADGKESASRGDLGSMFASQSASDLRQAASDILGLRVSEPHPDFVSKPYAVQDEDGIQVAYSEPDSAPETWDWQPALSPYAGGAPLRLLTLHRLRSANQQRQREQIPGAGTNLGLSFRAMELGGEMGEFVERIGILLKLLNTAKKLERERRGLPGSTVEKEQLADEGADVVICVDLLLMEAGQSLDAAIERVFNRASEMRNLKTRL